MLLTEKSSEMNIEKTNLIQCLKEVGLSLKRFLKVDDKKRAFEKEWQNKLYTPEELKDYPLWGICGGGGLVLIDADNQKMAKILQQILPRTFEVLSSKRKLPHFYFKITGGKVENKTLRLPETNEDSGEIRVNNQYLVAAGTQTLHGIYKIIVNRPIAELTYDKFMKAIIPYLGKAPNQRLAEEQIKNGVDEGERHTIGIKYANYLIGGLGFDYKTALIEMKRWNKTCRPPNNESELERMALDAFKYSTSEKVQSNKRNEKKSTEKIMYSPGFLKDGIIFEQIEGGNFPPAVKQWKKVQSFGTTI